MKEKKLFYGWYVVFASFIMLAASIGIGWNGISPLIKPICEDMGYTRPQIAMCQTVLYGGYLVLCLLSGKIFKAFSMKALLKVGTFIMPISWIIFSRANSLFMFYLAIAISTVGVFCVGMMPVSIILGNWFHEKTGFVIGMTFMGSGFGGMCFNSLTGILTENFGWRVCVLVMAIIMLVLIFPCAWFVIKIHPAEMGLKPLGDRDDTPAESAAPTVQLTGYTLQECYRLPKFWLVCLVIILNTMPANNSLYLISPHLSDLGYSLTFAANMSAIAMGSMALGKFALGILHDKLGVRGACCLATFSGFVAMVGLYFTKNPIFLVFVFLGVALSPSFGSVSLPLLSKACFGEKDHGAIYGVISAVSSLGGMFVPMISNLMFEALGSYNLVFILCGALALSASLGFFLVLPSKTKEN